MNDLHTFSSVGEPSAVAGGCPPIVSEGAPKRWFVMRATYSRELKAQALLCAEGVECFVPMTQQRMETGDKMIPAVHNLIFVYSTRTFLDAYKQHLEDVCPLRYAMDAITGKPMVVPDKQMMDFMRMVREADADIIYLDNPAAAVHSGMEVEVAVGPYQGVRGRLLRIRRDRKVVLQLAGMVAIAISGIPLGCLKQVI